MKKYIVLSLFLPLFALASFNRDLYFGLRQDPDVDKLQEFLTEQKVYTGPITGNFFSLTLKGVKDFQTTNFISPVSGYFGPLSRDKANKILTSQGVFDSSVTNESGTQISPIITPPKNTDDVVAKLMEQITILQKQLTELQNHQTFLGSIQQQQTMQTQVLEQIQQNTIPPSSSSMQLLPLPLSPPTPADKSNLVIDVRVFNDPSIFGYNFFVNVLDKNGDYVKDTTVSMVASRDNLAFSPSLKAGKPSISNSGNLGGNLKRDGACSNCDKPHAYFAFFYNEFGTTTDITFIAGTLTKTITISQ